ncbi:MAG: hypothetical protein AB7G76_05900 [Steroidobacteraceae bacterium]
MRRLVLAGLLWPLFAPGSGSAVEGGARAIAEAEATFADVRDAHGVLGAIDSGLFTSWRSRDRAAWQRAFDTGRQRLIVQVAALPHEGLGAADARVVARLREGLASFGEPSAPGYGAAKCEGAARPDLDSVALSRALVACFTEIANRLEFEGGTTDRASALARLSQIEEPARRKALFHAFAPLWQAVNGDNAPQSPYRRLMALAGARPAPSAIDAAARTVGTDRAEVERWLVRILDAWRESNDRPMIEPWDYRYAMGTADRLLSPRIPLASLLAIDHRFYRDLGVRLDAPDVYYDIEPRPGKSSVAYTDFLIHGRYRDGRWEPTVARVLASYRHGSLGALNELVHEDGHVAHITAIRNRPVYVDWNDTLFVEAFADVPSWSLYEPAWQRRYLGTEAAGADSLRALYGSVMLDVSWALFECRMLRDPKLDPNIVWTDITSRYLRITPHPEIPWWLARVQLVDEPGYMVNYGLGAIVTAALRARTRAAIGPFDAGNARWYPWLSDALLRYGAERDTPTLLREFLGGPVSPDALLAELRRMAAVR